MGDTTLPLLPTALVSYPTTPSTVTLINRSRINVSDIEWNWRFNSSSCGQEDVSVCRDYMVLFPSLRSALTPLFVRGEPKNSWVRDNLSYILPSELVHILLWHRAIQQGTGRHLILYRSNRHDLGTFQTKPPRAAQLLQQMNSLPKNKLQ